MKRDTSLNWHKVDVASLDLKGTRAAVIGGTGGIGRSLARVLVSQGARVTVVGQTFRDAGVPGLDFMKADLSLMREAQRVGRELPAEILDLVVMTTGVMAGPQRETTADGLERDMAVSYLSRLVLLRELGPRLGAGRDPGSPRTRVFVMGFPGNGQAGKLGDLNAERSYGRWAVHMNTVAGNEALVLDAVTRYPHVDVFGLNPGLVRTGIRSNLFGRNKFLLKAVEWASGFMTIAPEAYAERIAPLLLSRDLEGRSGAMFDNKGVAIRPTPALMDRSHREAFVKESETLVASRLEPVRRDQEFAAATT